MTRYKCPECKAEADIDKENKKIQLVVAKEKMRTEGAFSFPSHVDCELAKPLSKMDTSKLEEIG